MQNSNHPIEAEDLMAYLDGELPVDRAAGAAAHLEHCRQCQGVAADLQVVSRKLMSWQVEPSEGTLSPALAAALEERARKRGKLRNAFRMRPWIWALAGAAAALLLVALPKVTSYSKMGDLALSSDGQLAADQYGTRSQAIYLPAPPPAAASHTKVMREVQQTTADQLKAQPSGFASAPVIARTAGLTLATREFDKTRAAVDEILKRHHGYPANLTLTAPDGSSRTLTGTLRVPEPELDAAMSEWKKLARVVWEQQIGADVTAEVTDLEARLVNARNTERRLTDLLAQRTGKLSDVLAVEVEIDRVRGDIERMEGERKGLADRVTFATVMFTLTEDYSAPLQMLPGSPLGRLRNAAVQGYGMMVGGVVGVALFLASYGPSILLWSALLFFPARFAWRKLRRKPV